MRRSVKFLVLALLFSLTLMNFDHAAYADLGKGPIQKLSRGLVHVLASPFQLPKEVIQTTGEGETVWLAPIKGMSEGVGKGLYEMVCQAFSGLIDIFTFWTPAGRDWAPVFEPPSMFPQV